jgi:hypothetical protein
LKYYNGLSGLFNIYQKIFIFNSINLSAFLSGRRRCFFKKSAPLIQTFILITVIVETDSINQLDVENVYNGGGIGIGDFNNDGLPDLFFTGNLVSCKLYLNEGNFRFRDITDEAKVTGEGIGGPVVLP